MELIKYQENLSFIQCRDVWSRGHLCKLPEWDTPMARHLFGHLEVISPDGKYVKVLRDLDRGRNDWEAYACEPFWWETAEFKSACSVDVVGINSFGTETTDGWLSPIASERAWQEKHLKKIFPSYPNSSPKWQVLNGLIRMACNDALIEIEEIASND